MNKLALRHPQPGTSAFAARRRDSAERHSAKCVDLRFRGISLLEVLISMFVLLFGLMGVAAMFPVGNHYAASGQKYDRAASAAPIAFAELHNRGMLRPENWIYAGDAARGAGLQGLADARTSNASLRLYPNQSPVVVQDGYSKVAPGWFNYLDSTNTNLSVIGPGRAFVIDPMGVAAGFDNNRSNGDVFPYSSFDGNNNLPTPSDSASNNLIMPQEWQRAPDAVPRGLAPLPGANAVESYWPIRRVTIKGTDNSNQFAFRYPPLGIAETMVRLNDDLAVAVPEKNDEPGQSLWRLADTNNSAALDDDVIPVKRQFGGAYSWLATVVPTSTDGLLALQPSSPAYGRVEYEVTVAFFSRRDEVPSSASERSITAEMTLGGELVIYSTLSNDVDAMDAVNGACEDLRAGQWIMLAGCHPTTGDFLLKWYRILSIQDEVVDADASRVTVYGIGGRRFVGRRLMLAGPEWPMVRNGNNIPIHAPFLRAIILPGVIGTTTQTIHMTQDSAWTIERPIVNQRKRG